MNALALRAEAAESHAPTGFRYRAAKLGPRLGADRLDGTVVELDPGEGLSYHYVHGREEWLLVLLERPACPTRKARIVSRPAISCATRAAWPAHLPRVREPRIEATDLGEVQRLAHQTGVTGKALRRPVRGDGPPQCPTR